MPEHDQQEPRLIGANDATALQTQKASLAQQQLQLADQLASTRESAGRQEAGHPAATAATQEQGFWTGPQSSEVFLAAVAKWLVFSDPAPVAATAAPHDTIDGTATQQPPLTFVRSRRGTIIRLLEYKSRHGGSIGAPPAKAG
jgi:hypothetical protein